MRRRISARISGCSNDSRILRCCGSVKTISRSRERSSSPLLVITAQTAITNFGKRAAQESGDTGINTVAMFEHCTHYSSLISHADQFERKLTTAVMRTQRAPKGPAHLSIPLDVFRNEASVRRPSYDLMHLFGSTSLIDEERLDKLVNELLDSRRTVFIVGEQCAEAISYILDVALMLNIEIVTICQSPVVVSITEL